MRAHRRLQDTYGFRGFRLSPPVHGIFGDAKARVNGLQRRGKTRAAARMAAPIERVTTVSSAEYANCRAGTRGPSWSWKSGASPVTGGGGAESRPSRKSPGNAPGLADGQGPGNAVHEGIAASGADPSSRGDRGRRDLDPDGVHLPHRGQLPAALAANLVPGQRPLGSEHGRGLPVAGPQEEQDDPARGHGSVEGVPQSHPQAGPRAAGPHPVRQVPFHVMRPYALESNRRIDRPCAVWQNYRAMLTPVIRAVGTARKADQVRKRVWCLLPPCPSRIVSQRLSLT